MKIKSKTGNGEIAPFTEKVVAVILAIPPGRVLSYGRVAALAGNSRGARQVSRILHSMSQKYDLPWHRVVNAEGRISLPRGQGFELQKALLEFEGVSFSSSHIIDLSVYLWLPDEKFCLESLLSSSGK